jgi:NADH-quinone oxidoreductase subunit C
MPPESQFNPLQPTAPAAASPAVKPAVPVASAAKPAVAAAAAPVVPPPAPVPNPLPEIPLPFKGVDFSLKGYNADATVSPEQVVAAAEAMDKAGFSLDTITGVDWIAEGQMEVVYDFLHATRPLRAVVRTRLPRENAKVATISHIYGGANWHERETHDFFGIEFVGHPNLTPFLLEEDATYHPLRKDYKK